MICSICDQEMKLIQDFGEEKIYRCDKCEFEALEKEGRMVKWIRYGHIIKEKDDDKSI